MQRIVFPALLCALFFSTRSTFAVEWSAGPSHNNHSYLATPLTMSWTDANALANSMGGYLASVLSAAENDFLQASFFSGAEARTAFWIGFTDAASEGHFVWTSGEAATYTNWPVGEPNNFANPSDPVPPFDEDYAVINWQYANNPFAAPGQWNDAPNLGTTPNGTATQPYRAIVEFDHPVPEPTGMAVALLTAGSMVLIGAMRNRLSRHAPDCTADRQPNCPYLFPGTPTRKTAACCGLLGGAALLWTAAAYPPTARAAPVVYFGLDDGPGPLSFHPNADAARAAFLAGLAPGTDGLENFDSFGPGLLPSGGLTVSFVPTEVTGVISPLSTLDTQISNETTSLGQYPISPPNYLRSFTDSTGRPTQFFSVEFSSPQTAFGFYGTDFSDLSGGPQPPGTEPSISATLRSAAGDITLPILGGIDPTTVHDGAVIFWGVFDVDHPISMVTLSNPASTVEGIGVDDLIVGRALVPEPGSGVLLWAGAFALVTCCLWCRRVSTSGPAGFGEL